MLSSGALVVAWTIFSKILQRILWISGLEALRSRVASVLAARLGTSQRQVFEEWHRVAIACRVRHLRARASHGCLLRVLVAWAGAASSEARRGYCCAGATSRFSCIADDRVFKDTGSTSLGSEGIRTEQQHWVDSLSTCLCALSRTTTRMEYYSRAGARVATGKMQMPFQYAVESGEQLLVMLRELTGVYDIADRQEKCSPIHC